MRLASQSTLMENAKKRKDTGGKKKKNQRVAVSLETSSRGENGIILRGVGAKVSISDSNEMNCGCIQQIMETGATQRECLKGNRL